MANTFGLTRSLGCAIGAIALVSLLSSGAVLITLDQQNEVIAARRQSNVVLRGLDAFRTAMIDQETGLRGYLLTGRETSLEPYRSGRRALDETIGRLGALIPAASEGSLLFADAVTAARSWQSDIGETAIRAAAVPATRPDAIRIEVDGSGKRLFDALRERLSAVEALEGRNNAALGERLARAGRDAQIALWGGALLTLAICIAIGIAIHRRIARPLVGVMAFVERVGAGDLSGTLEARRRDEIGRLGATLNAMVAGLSDLARTNRSTTADLNTAAAEIRASAQQQFAAVQETAATMDEITHTGAQIGKRASEVIATAQATARTSREGLRAVSDTGTAMDAIRDQAGAVAGNIVGLSEKTQAIGEIIETVNDISERTHLLALNAAIEGEAGRGFTVVASEMKLLADQARAATGQVRAILGEIQRGINTSVMLTEEAVKRAATGKERSDATQRAIEEIAARAEEGVQVFQQVVASVNQQQMGIEQVMGALTNIRQASQQTAVGTRQVEAASADLPRLAQALMTLAERYQHARSA